MRPSPPLVLLLMGVAGAGKTTIGRLLAQELGWPFVDGDDLHPPANVDKMRRGIPLTDADRWPWLQAVRRCIEAYLAEGQSAVVACSALKQAYRELLQQGDARVVLVYLRGEEALLRQRLAARRGHFFAPQLLASQLAALEAPHDALVVDVALPPQEIVRTIRTALGL
ncbi:MAG: gluconokinase [Candidatus Tectimicrobiota bacterium]|nr:MAG: gluconokinase [Candidatus Tectomicrobia bacterium]